MHCSSGPGTNACNDSMTASTGGRRPSAHSSIKLADLCGQIAQRAYPNRRNAVRIEIVLLDDAPRTTADQHGLHPGLRGGCPVVLRGGAEHPGAVLSGQFGRQVIRIAAQQRWSRPPSRSLSFVKPSVLNSRTATTRKVHVRALGPPVEIS